MYHIEMILNTRSSSDAVTLVCIIYLLDIGALGYAHILKKPFTSQLKCVL